VHILHQLLSVKAGLMTVVEDETCLCLCLTTLTLTLLLVRT